MDSRQDIFGTCTNVNEVVKVAQRTAKLADFVLARAEMFGAYVSAVERFFQKARVMELPALQGNQALLQLMASMQSDILLANRVLAQR